MNWQVVVELEAASLEQVLAQLAAQAVSPAVLDRVRATLTAQFVAAAPWVSVYAPGPSLGGVQNFFVVQAGALEQAQLELYLY